MANSMTFNAIDFADYGLVVTSCDANEVRKQSSFIRIKDFSVTGTPTREPKMIWSKITVKGTSRTVLDGYLDNIKMALDSSINREVSFDCISGRYWNAKLERFDGKYISPYVFVGDVQLLCSDPLAYSSTLTSSDHVIDADPKEVNEVTTGSAFVRPVFTFTATAAIGATTFKLENTNTSEELVWTDTIANTEELIINSENWLVTLEAGASMTNVSGQFPTLLPGQTNTIKVTGGNSGTLNIKYRMRYV